MARFARRKYVRRSRGGRGKYRLRRRSRFIPRRGKAKAKYVTHHYVRSLEGTFAPNAAITGAWTSSSGQFALADCTGTSFDPPSSAPGLRTIAGAATFNIGWATNTSELSVLYDAYKIKKVKITLECGWNQHPINADLSTSVTVAGPTPPMPHIRWYVDHDDATVPSVTDADAFLQRPDVKKATLKGRISMNVFPRMKIIDSNNNRLITKSRWTDFSNTTTPHYGLKFLMLDMPNYGTGLTGYTKPFIRWRADYYIACKDPR